jgi:ribosomal protein S18 acetylase RimI-like enzyme
VGGEEIRETVPAAGVTLRPARAGDEPFLYALYCSTRAEEVAAWGLPAAQRETFLQMQFKGQQRHYEVQSPNVDYNVVEQDGSPIGQLVIIRTGREIRLADISLLPEHRGTGIGTALIGDLFAEARSSHKPVSLHVGKSNRAARLYERLGFMTIADKGFHLLMEWRPERGKERMAEEFTLEMFSDKVNTIFQMHYGGSEAVPLELVSVTDLGSTPRQIQFSAIFRGPESAPIHQGIYRVDHDKMGSMNLFLVPIGKDAKGVEYQAIFNRVIE